ncbi:hypothetical protein ACO0QE_000126 [Hanseniaspora vineae]
MRIDGNTVLFIFFIIFFVILPNNERDQGSTQYEVKQIQYAKDQLRYELAFLNNNIASIHNIPGNITGFKYTQEDLSLNHDNYETSFVKNESLGTPWLGYPIEGKDYRNGWVNYHSKGNILPQNVLDTVNEQVWTNKTKVDEANLLESVYPWNLTSALRGIFGKPESKNTDSVLYLPRPKYYRQQLTFTDPDYFNPPDNNNMNEKREDDQEISLADLELPQFGDEFLNYSTESINYREDYVNFTDRPFQVTIDEVYQYNHEWKIYSLDFKDSKDLSRNQLPMIGIYNVLKGQLLTFTQSSKFHPLFVAPSYFFNENEDDFHNLKDMVNTFINKTNYIDTFNREDLNTWETRANMRCEYMGYFQVAKWQGFNARDMDMFERELAKPMGRPIAHKNPPKIEISNGVLYSPDCGLYYQFDKFAGNREEIAVQKIRWDIIFFVTIPYMLQLFIFLKQMNFTNTPSRLNKVSRTTIDMLTLTDGTMAMTLFISAIVMDSLFVPLMVSSFFAFFLTLVFGIRYMSNIIVSQINERIISWRSLFRSSGHDNADGGGTETAQTGADATTTAPAAAATPVANVIPDESQLTSDLNAKFMFKLFLSTFTMMTIASWSSDSRNVLEGIAIVLCNSYWLPQISRNFLIDINPDLVGLNFKWFVVGTSYVRLVPVVYIYGVKANIFHHHQSKMFILLMFVYVTLQIVVIKLQHTVGGRNVLPKVFMKHLNKYMNSKKKYEYHRKFTTGEVEEHGAVFSCPICMDEDDPIKVMVDVCDDSSSENDQHSNSANDAEDHESQKTSLDKYMVTPCYHVFHTTCLVTWMNTKLQCPVCRQPLPPL